MSHKGTLDQDIGDAVIQVQSPERRELEKSDDTPSLLRHVDGLAMHWARTSVHDHQLHYGVQNLQETPSKIPMLVSWVTMEKSPTRSPTSKIQNSNIG